MTDSFTSLASATIIQYNVVVSFLDEVLAVDDHSDDDDNDEGIYLPIYYIHTFTFYIG